MSEEYEISEASRAAQARIASKIAERLLPSTTYCVVEGRGIRAESWPCTVYEFRMIHGFWPPFRGAQYDSTDGCLWRVTAPDRIWAWGWTVEMDEAEQQMDEAVEIAFHDGNPPTTSTTRLDKFGGEAQ